MRFGMGLGMRFAVRFVLAFLVAAVFFSGLEVPAQ